jgi:hypothetical protein
MLLKACPGAFFALLNLIIAVKIKEAEVIITIIVKVRIHSREFFRYLNIGFRNFAEESVSSSTSLYRLSYSDMVEMASRFEGPRSEEALGL